MTTALITGVSGQDGGYLAERLLAEGVLVHGMVREFADAGPAAQAMPGLQTHVCDLNDVDAVAELVKQLAPDEIYNLDCTGAGRDGSDLGVGRRWFAGFRLATR